MNNPDEKYKQMMRRNALIPDRSIDLDLGDRAYPLMTDQEIWDDVSTPIDKDTLAQRRFPPKQ